MDTPARASASRSPVNPPTGVAGPDTPPGHTTSRDTRRRRLSEHPRSISPATRARVFERDGFRCRRCGSGSDVARLVVDHVVAVARGGTRELANLQTLCHDCNAGKGARPPHPVDLAPRSSAARRTWQPHPDGCRRCRRPCYAVWATPAGAAGFRAGYRCACGATWECFWAWGQEIAAPDPTPLPNAYAAAPRCRWVA